MEVVTFRITAGNVTLKMTLAMTFPFSSGIIFNTLRKKPKTMIIRKRKKI